MAEIERAEADRLEAYARGVEKSFGVVLFALATVHPELIGRMINSFDHASRSSREEGAHPEETGVYDRLGEWLRRGEATFAGRAARTE